MVKPRIRAVSFAVTASTLFLAPSALSQTTPLPSLPPPAAPSSTATQTPATTPPPPAYAQPADPLPALPPAPPSSELPAPPPPRSSERGDEEPRAEKRWGIGVDLMLMLPVGDYSKATGVLLGPLLRVGYRLTPRIELSGRAGFLFGFNKDQPVDLDGMTFSTSQTLIPIWLGGRYFILRPGSGLYARAEVGLNLYQSHFHSDVDLSGDTSSAEKVKARVGFDVGAGYVLSGTLPIDIHVQFTYLNLIGNQTDVVDNLSEDTFIGIGIGVGYTLSF